jgi:hypothetical protein
MSPRGDDALGSIAPGRGIVQKPLLLNDLNCRTHVRVSNSRCALASCEVARDQVMMESGSDTAGCLNRSVAARGEFAWP